MRIKDIKCPGSQFNLTKTSEWCNYDTIYCAVSVLNVEAIHCCGNKIAVQIIFIYTLLDYQSRYNILASYIYNRIDNINSCTDRNYKSQELLDCHSKFGTEKI